MGEKTFLSRGGSGCSSHSLPRGQRVYQGVCLEPIPFSVFISGCVLTKFMDDTKPGCG